MECQVTPLVSIVTLLPMDHRNPTVLNSIHLENLTLSHLNEMHCTNMVYQWNPLDSICVTERRTSVMVTDFMWEITLMKLGTRDGLPIDPQFPPYLSFESRGLS